MPNNKRTPAGLAAASGVEQDALSSRFIQILPKDRAAVNAIEDALAILQTDADARYVREDINGEVWAGFERLIQAGQLMLQAARSA